MELEIFIHLPFSLDYIWASNQLVTMTIKILLFFASISILVWSSCAYDNGEDLYPNRTCETDSLTYDNQIGPLINNSCATTGCHAAGGLPPRLTNYAEVLNNLGRIEQRAVIDKTMPPSGPLGTCQLSQLSEWINQGAPEN